VLRVNHDLAQLVAGGIAGARRNVSTHYDILEIPWGGIGRAGGGSFGFSGEGGPATSAQLHRPGSVAMDSAGNVYTSDFYNLRISEVSEGIITTVVGDGG